MGYSHSWEQYRPFSKVEWEKILAEAEVILACEKAKGIELDSAKGADAILVRGAKQQSCEDFLFLRAPEKHRRYDHALSYCKTELLPYNQAVVSILEAAKRIAPDAISFSSDKVPGEKYENFTDQRVQSGDLFET